MRLTESIWRSLPMIIPVVLHPSTYSKTHPDTFYPSCLSTGEKDRAGTEEHSTSPAYDLTFPTNGTDLYPGVAAHDGLRFPRFYYSTPHLLDDDDEGVYSLVLYGRITVRSFGDTSKKKRDSWGGTEAGDARAV